jgi:hypothetical protein
MKFPTAAVSLSVLALASAAAAADSSIGFKLRVATDTRPREEYVQEATEVGSYPLDGASAHYYQVHKSFGNWAWRALNWVGGRNTNPHCAQLCKGDARYDEPLCEKADDGLWRPLATTAGVTHVVIYNAKKNPTPDCHALASSQWKSATSTA